MFRAHDEDTFVRTLYDLNEKYPAFGTQAPVDGIIQWYTATYYWPISTPLPPIGESVLLVSEQSYISYTSNPP